MQRAPALCGVWRRVSVASLTLACAMRGDCDSNPGPSGHAVRLYRLHQARPSLLNYMRMCKLNCRIDVHLSLRLVSASSSFSLAQVPSSICNTHITETKAVSTHIVVPILPLSLCSQIGVINVNNYRMNSSSHVTAAETALGTSGDSWNGSRTDRLPASCCRNIEQIN